MVTQTEIFLTPNEERNFALLVESRKLWISKEVLSMHSCVFKRQFYEENDANSDFLELPNKRFDDVVEFMSCIFAYPTPKPVDDVNVGIVLKLSHEFQVENLKRNCGELLENRLLTFAQLTANQCLLILQKSIQYDLRDVIVTAISRTASILTINQIRQCKETLPLHVLSALFEVKANRMEKELQNVHYCVKYAAGKKRNCVACVSSKTRNYCRKCNQYVCKSCQTKTCPSFHDVTCVHRARASSGNNKEDNYWRHGICLCGYEFDWP